MVPLIDGCDGSVFYRGRQRRCCGIARETK